MLFCPLRRNSLLNKEVSFIFWLRGILVSVDLYVFVVLIIQEFACGSHYFLDFNNSILIINLQLTEPASGCQFWDLALVVDLGLDLHSLKQTLLIIVIWRGAAWLKNWPQFDITTLLAASLRKLHIRIRRRTSRERRNCPWDLGHHRRRRNRRRRLRVCARYLRIPCMRNLTLKVNLRCLYRQLRLLLIGISQRYWRDHMNSTLLLSCF